MAHDIHPEYVHLHHEGCGHTMIAHEGHRDFLDNGHLHHVHGRQVDDHRIAESDVNPSLCTPAHKCDGHPAYHHHSPFCGHEAVPHEDHIDYLVAGHLHHAHGDHCDFHGKVERRDIARRRGPPVRPAAS